MAVVTGSGRIDGRPVALIVNEFDFLAGSIGSRAADRILAAIGRATAERLPLLASTCSGGTRMQEGTPAFVKMAPIARALAEHKAAGLPYLVYLRHPTTGGVSASFAMLGDVNIAEPGALIGFAGPRVIEQTVREKLPEGFQRSEFLLDHGAIDQICDRREMRERLAHLLAMMMNQPMPADDAEEAA